MGECNVEVDADLFRRHGAEFKFAITSGEIAVGKDLFITNFAFRKFRSGEPSCELKVGWVFKR